MTKHFTYRHLSTRSFLRRFHVLQVSFSITFSPWQVPEAVRALSDRYRCYVAPMQPNKGGKGGNGGGKGGGSSGAQDGRLLSYWCFSPGVAMEELKAMGVCTSLRLTRELSLSTLV